MNNKFDYILSSLNPQQKEIVESSANLLVTACPGSGKTRVLTRKMAYTALLNEQSWKKIIAITYTNRAADEIKDRLELLDIDTASIWAGTIHQFCLEYVLRPFAMSLPRLSKGFKIIDEYVSEKYIKQILVEKGINLPFFEIQKIKTDLCLKNKIKETKQREAVKQYHSILKDSREIDFDLILTISLHILNTHPIATTNIANILRTIFVDEYQDTNEKQYLIIGSLAKANPSVNLLFVGDTDQAIYGTLGGVAKSIDEIKNITGLAFEMASLNGCYRSVQRIVDYYSHFQNQSYKIQSLSTNSKSAGNICLDTAVNKTDIYTTISSIIKEKIDSNIPQEEICVIAPQWTMLYPLSNKLRELLPGVSFDAPDISPIKIDDLSIFYKFAKIIFTESGQKVKRRKRIATEILTMLTSDFNVNLQPHIDNYWLLQKINSIRPTSTNGLEYYKHIVEMFFHDCGIIQNDYPVLFEQYHDFLEKTEGRIERYSDISSELDGFIKMFKERDGVVITSCHKIKGEEYNTVIAFGLLQGMIPHWDIIINSGNAAALAEAKKMLYVVASRAKESLYLIAEQGRTRGNGNPYALTDVLRSYRYQYDTST